jgi:outer membrane protein
MKNKIRALGSRFVAASLIWLVSAPLALAQTEALARVAPKQNDQPQQAQTGDQQELVVGAVKPVMQERVGVDPNQILRLSLHDAILMVLQNNNDIQVQRTNVQIADYNLEGQRGRYDMVVDLSTQWSNSKSPIAQPNITFDSSGSLFIEGGQAYSYNEVLNYTGSISQQLPWYGTAWKFTLDNRRTLIKSASTAFINPSYNSALRLEFSQPLWRNFRIDQTRSQIRIAQKATDLSDSLFRQKVIDIITQVQKSYWDLVFALRAVEIQQEALDLARTNLENNRKQVEAGTTAPIELAQSEAQVEQRRQDLTTAVGGVTAAENVLKILMMGDPRAPEWKANVAPTESIGYLAPVIDFESATNMAMANRPEFDQLRLQKEQKDVEIKFYKNQTRPQIDLIGSYATSGLKGTPDPDQVSTYFPDLMPGEVPAELGPLVGGPGDALRATFDNQYRTTAFGLKVNFPIRNRTAEASLGRSLAERRNLNFQDSQLTQYVTMQVRNALQSVQTARQNIDAARAARVARQTQLDGEQKKFEAGLSTTYFVLTYQTYLSQARLAELQALVSYNKAIADLQQVLSTTLSAHNVEVSSRPSSK